MLTVGQNTQPVVNVGQNDERICTRENKRMSTLMNLLSKSVRVSIDLLQHIHSLMCTQRACTVCNMLRQDQLPRFSTSTVIIITNALRNTQLYSAWGNEKRQHRRVASVVPQHLHLETPPIGIAILAILRTISMLLRSIQAVKLLQPTTCYDFTNSLCSKRRGRPLSFTAFEYCEAEHNVNDSQFQTRHVKLYQVPCR